MNVNNPFSQKLDYEHFANLGFTKGHVDLAFSNIKSYDSVTLVNWLLDNPEEKVKSKLEFLKFSQELDQKLKSKSLFNNLLPQTLPPKPLIQNPTIVDLLGLKKTNEPKSLEIKKSEHVQAVLQSIPVIAESLPLKVAKEEILDKVVNTEHKNYNIWLKSLGEIVEKVQSEGFKYKALLEEIKKKSHREVAKLLHCLFGSMTLILQRSTTDSGEFKELDIHSFYHFMNIFYDLGVFTKAQRKCLVKQYEAYCQKKETKANKLFVGRILEQGYFEQKKVSEESSEQNHEQDAKKTEKEYLELDIDVTEVDDDVKEIVLDEGWFEGIEKEIEATKNVKREKELKEANELAAKLKDLNLPEKQFTGQALASGLTDREACVMCSQKMRAFLYMPCKHFLTCQDCTNIFKDCPVCQKPITQKLLLYWS